MLRQLLSAFKLLKRNHQHDMLKDESIKTLFTLNEVFQFFSFFKVFL